MTASTVCRLALFACWCFVTVASAQDGTTKNAVPVAARQTEIRKLVDDTFEVSKANTPAKKQVVAQKLTEMIVDPTTTPDELFVALQLVLALQRDLGDFAAYSIALDKLTESFEVDAAAEKTTRITEYLVACKSSTTLEPAVDEVVEMAERAARDNQFRQAHELLTTAERHSKRVSAVKVLKALNEVRSGLRGREQAFASLTSAQRTLMNQPNDPKANLAAGQWFAVYEADWEQALPKLKLGSDAKWKAAAELDSKAAQDVESQLAAADAWWDVSQTATGAAKVAIQGRAHEWYERYFPNVKTPLTKARISKRIEELAATLATAPQVASVSTTIPESSDATGKSDLKIDKWTDLLGTVNFSEHALKGTWQNLEGNLVAPTGEAVVMFPIALQGSFELNCEFTPPSDRAVVKFAFPTGSTSCGIIFNADNNAFSGLELIDGIGVKDLNAATGAVTRPSRLTAEKRNQVQISVAQVKDRISINARLDGKRITSWTGQSSQLSQSCPYLARMIPCPQSIGISVNGGAIFHKCEIRLNKGARAFWLRDDWKNPVTQVAANPSKSIEANCLTWRGRRYLFSDQAVTFPDAQRLAVQVQGRVLTISSPEEEAFVTENIKDHPIWLSGWRRENRKEWLDERNRPLKYFGKWALSEPSMIYTEPNLRVVAKKGDKPEWADINPDHHFHAVIEWGEEYAESKSK
ncbi:MAG: hypothetical protein JWP89_157 [Schlesneria sp.]|nr:hypothetical protein [Schlesneria sp.]